MFKKIARLIAPVALAAGLIAAGAATAQAASGNQWNQNGTGAYINAFGGNVQGNLIKINVGKTVNDDFTLVNDGDGTWELLFSGTSSVGSNCIADNGNNQNDAKAALYNCSSSGVPWGARFTIQACGSRGTGYYFKNVHWGRYLNAVNNSQGTQVYLNGDATCYIREGI